MPRNITVTFDDGTTHVYANAPDDVSPDQVQARASKEFGKAVKALDGGRGTAPVVGEAKPAQTDETPMQRAGNLVAGAVRGAGSIGATLLTLKDCTPHGQFEKAKLEFFPNEHGSRLTRAMTYAEAVSFFCRLRVEFPELAKVATHIRNEGKRTKRQGHQHQQEGMNTGASDVIIPVCPPIVMEMKRRDHTLSSISKEQVDYLVAAASGGAFTGVALGAAAPQPKATPPAAGRRPPAAACPARKSNPVYYGPTGTGPTKA